MTETTSSFADFSLPEQLTKAIDALGFTAPTPIQKGAIPLVLEGRDVISLAETGSGKTAAYLIPAIAKALEEPNGNVLVLAPTRELAVQITEVLRTLTTQIRDMNGVTVIGGSPMFKQTQGLRRRPRFIIATPGRLMDHIRQRNVDMRSISMLILDEADRMFDMGFAPQVDQIVRQLPEVRQTLLFSATFPKEIRGLANRVLTNPVEVEVRTTTNPPVAITQKIIETDNAKKDDLTLDLINAAENSVLIFTRTKHRADRLTKYLLEYGVAVTKIHGDRSQGQRNKSIQDFKSGECKVMVATDIAARGLDVQSVSDVINYDLPMTAEDYTHRVGRTGRAGQKGTAHTLLTPHDRSNWSYIARKVGMPGSKENGRPQERPQARGNGGGRGEGRPERNYARPKRPNYPAPRTHGHHEDRRERPARAADSRSGEGRPAFGGGRSNFGKRPEGRTEDRPQFGARPQRDERPQQRDERPQRRDEGGPRRPQFGGTAPRRNNGGGDSRNRSAGEQRPRW